MIQARRRRRRKQAKDNCEDDVAKFLASLRPYQREWDTARKTRVEPSTLWTRVSVQFLCPICGGADNCTVSNDGRVVYCGRIKEGSIRQNAGGQFLHPIKNPLLKTKKPQKTAETGPSGNRYTYQQLKQLAEKYAEAATNRRSRSRRALAKELGVDVAALKALGIGWDGTAWTFPEKDSAENVIGILRRFPDGSKQSIAGGKRGLSFPPGSNDIDLGPVLIVEGPTDVAAALTLGIATIGRPSNLGGADLLVELLEGYPSDRDIIVLGENDKKPDGTWPGKDGAEKTAEKLSRKLGRNIQWAMTPDEEKDIRSWLQEHGCESKTFLSRLEIQAFEPPKCEGLRWQRFPLQCLPVSVGQLGAKAAKSIGCDPSFVVVPMLAAMASAIGNSRTICLKLGWEEPAVIWAFTVGLSGSLKSPALDVALKLVRKRQSELYEYYKFELSQWNDMTPDEKKDSTQPILQRVVVSDITVEALVERLYENINGLLLANDEMSAWLRGFNQYKGGRGTDVPSYLTMHRASQLIVDRKSGERQTVFIEKSALSITGGVQPGVLKELLTKQRFDEGLSARMLFAMPPRIEKRWTDDELTENDLEPVEKVFAELYKLQDAVNMPPLTLSDDAKTLFQDFFNRHAQEDSSLTGDLSSAWAKYEGYAARLALVIHLGRWASIICNKDEAENLDPNVVDQRSMACAITITEWFKNEVRRVYSLFREFPEQALQHELVELIQRKGGTVVVRDIRSSSRQFGTTADEIEKHFTGLKSAGLGDWQVVNTDGRQRREFTLF